MPQRYTNHQPPALDHEIKDLWSAVDQLRDATGVGETGPPGEVGPPGPPGPVGPPGQSTSGILHWTYKVDISIPVESGFRAFDIDVHTIDGPYTHLDLTWYKRCVANGFNMEIWTTSQRQPDIVDEVDLLDPTKLFRWFSEEGPAVRASVPVGYRGFGPINTKNGDVLRLIVRPEGITEGSVFDGASVHNGWIVGRYIRHDLISWSRECPGVRSAPESAPQNLD